MKEPKFRPALTLPQIHYLLSLLAADTAQSTEKLNKQTVQQLKLLTIKVDIGAVNPAYTSSAKQSTEDRLGLSYVSPEERRLQAYKKCSENPRLCTRAEMLDAMTYKYQEGMMTAEEEEAFELGNGG